MCMLCMTSMAMHAVDHSAHHAPAATPDAAQTESLLAILKRRYALGEITTAQFEEMKRALDLSTVTQTGVESAHH